MTSPGTLTNKIVAKAPNSSSNADHFERWSARNAAARRGRPCRSGRANVFTYRRGRLAVGPLLPPISAYLSCRIRIAKHRQPNHGFRFRVYGLASTLWVLAPIRDQSPTQRVKRHLAGVAIAPDDEKFLARCRIVPPRIIAGPTVVDVHAVHDRQIKRSTALDHPSAHDVHIVRMRLSHIPRREPVRIQEASTNSSAYRNLLVARQINDVRSSSNSGRTAAPRRTAALGQTATFCTAKAVDLFTIEPP